jgi:hypothetical protein
MIGFTGTQRGVTVAQQGVIWLWLNKIEEPEHTWFHHGDCIGADHDFHRMVRRIGGNVYLHPPDIDAKRAFCDYDTEEDPRPYLERNHRIVDSSELMIATPGESEEVLRSGTWATIRYALKTNTPLWVINPDGSTITDWTTAS